VTTATTPTKNTTVRLLQIFALLTAIGAFAQALLGGYLVTAQSATLPLIHNIVGLVTIVVAIVATILAGLSSRAGGNRGLMFHALGTAVILLVQYGIGEMGAGISHIVIGVVILLSAIALVTLSIRKPYARA
jgi:hypothetical protein